LGVAILESADEDGIPDGDDISEGRCGEKASGPRPVGAGCGGTIASREESDEMLVLLSELGGKVLAGEREDALWRVVEVAGRLCQEFPNNLTARMVADRYSELTLSFTFEASQQLRLKI